MGFVEELYFGNIRMNEKCYDRNTQYSKEMEKLCESEEKLNNLLSGEEKNLFLNYVDAGAGVLGITALENFKMGFKLGVQMMCDCFTDDGVFEDI